MAVTVRTVESNKSHRSKNSEYVKNTRVLWLSNVTSVMGKIDIKSNNSHDTRSYSSASLVDLVVLLLLMPLAAITDGIR